MGETLDGLSSFEGDQTNEPELTDIIFLSKSKHSDSLILVISAREFFMTAGWTEAEHMAKQRISNVIIIISFLQSPE